jgi:hypothetical protein
MPLALKASVRTPNGSWTRTACFEDKHNPVSPSVHVYYHVIKFQIEMEWGLSTPSLPNILVQNKISTSLYYAYESFWHLEEH